MRVLAIASVNAVQAAFRVTAGRVLTETIIITNLAPARQVLVEGVGSGEHILQIGHLCRHVGHRLIGSGEAYVGS